jgi:hypothetical protein
VREPLPDALPLDELIAQSDELVRAVLLGGFATPEQIDAQRPGSVANPELTPLAHLNFLRWLDRLHARGGKDDVATTVSAQSAEVDQAIADALSDRPQHVDCSDGETRCVYPKSYDTLRFLKSLDALLRFVGEEWHLAEIEQDLTVKLSEGVSGVRLLAPRMESLAVRLWAWIVTHPTAALPFDETKKLPDPPKWTRQLAPEDLLKLFNAHVAVNVLRLRIIGAAFPPDPASGDKSLLTFAGLLGAMVAENEPGAAARLMKQTALGQVLATRILAARAAREASESAKKRAAESR